MRVLITRPAGDAQAAAQALRARGHAVLLCPLITIERTPEPTPSLAATQAFIVTEAEGARVLAEAVGVRTFPVFCDSAGTAAELARLGFHDIRNAEGDATRLARLIERSLNPKLGGLFYACSSGAPINLSAMLNTMGFAVRMTPLYTVARAANLPVALAEALRDEALDAAVFFSADEARAFAQLVPRAGLERTTRRLIAVVAAPAVVAPLTALRFARLVTAPRSDAETVLALVDDALLPPPAPEAVAPPEPEPAADPEPAPDMPAPERPGPEIPAPETPAPAEPTPEISAPVAPPREVQVPESSGPMETAPETMAPASETETIASPPASQRRWWAALAAMFAARRAAAAAIEPSAAAVEQIRADPAPADVVVVAPPEPAPAAPPAPDRAAGPEPAPVDAPPAPDPLATAPSPVEPATPEAQPLPDAAAITAAPEPEPVTAGAMPEPIVAAETPPDAFAKPGLWTSLRTALARRRATPPAQAPAAAAPQHPPQTEAAPEPPTPAAEPIVGAPSGPEIAAETEAPATAEPEPAPAEKSRPKESPVATMPPAASDAAPAEPAPSPEEVRPRMGEAAPKDSFTIAMSTAADEPSLDETLPAASEGEAPRGARGGGRAARLLAEDAADARALHQRFRVGGGDTAPEPAAEPHAEAPGATMADVAASRRPPTRGVPGGLIVLLILLAAGVGAYLTAPQWLPSLRIALTPAADRAPAAAPAASMPAPAPAAPLPRLEALANDVAALNARLSALEQRPAPAAAEAIAALEKRIAALETTAKTAMPEGLNDSIVNQARQLTSITARVATLEAAIGNVARLEDVAARLNALEGKSAEANSVLALAERVAALEKRDSAAATALVLAAAQLRDAAVAGRGYTVELETVGQLAARAGVTFDAGPLAAAAADGLATVRELNESFPAMAAAAVRAGVVPDDTAGWFRRVLDRVLSIVSLRPYGRIEGTSPGAVVARAEQALRDGDIAAAVGELEGLSGPAAAAAAPWLARAKAHVAARRALDELTARSVGAMSATARSAPAAGPAAP